VSLTVLGLSGPLSHDPSAALYIDGKPAQKLTNANLVDELERLIRAKAAEKSAQQPSLIAHSQL